MKYNFDEIVPRRGSNSYKWDTAEDEDVLPMWVADMDFRTAPAIIRTLEKQVHHGVFGYTKVPQTYYDATISWFSRRHNFTINKEWILFTSGVVPALSAIIKALTDPGDKVIVQTPVYNCFFSSIRNDQCEIISNELICQDGTYTIDFADLEQKAADPKVKIMLLCSPHNPVGRVWTKEELLQIGEICLRNNVIVVSDEIHCDLIYESHTHVPYASINEKFLQNSVTCIAPTKTFNLAGIQVANIVAANKEIRKKIDKALNINEVCEINVFAIEALIAAYNEGEDWLEELKRYLYENYEYLKDFFSEYFPQLSVIKPEATYLIWVNCSAFKLTSKEITNILIEKQKLWVNEGTMYGKAGEGFIRINIACPKETLIKGLDRFKEAFK